MAIGFSVTLRNNRADAIAAFAGNGAKLALYDGTRPATGAAITSQVKLAEFTLASPMAGAASGGVLTITAPADTTGLAAGTCTWARITQSNGTTFVADLSQGSDFTLNTTTVSVGLTMSVNTATITEGNA